MLRYFQLVGDRFDLIQILWVQDQSSIRRVVVTASFLRFLLDFLFILRIIEVEKSSVGGFRSSGLCLSQSRLLHLLESSKLLQFSGGKKDRFEHWAAEILLSGLSLCQVLQLIIGHRDNGEDQVDQVERTEENVEDEESDVERSGCL